MSDDIEEDDVIEHVRRHPRKPYLNDRSPQDVLDHTYTIGQIVTGLDQGYSLDELVEAGVCNRAEADAFVLYQADPDKAMRHARKDPENKTIIESIKAIENRDRH